MKYIFIILLSFLCACSGSYLPQQYEKKVAKRDSTIFIQGNTMKDSFEVQYLGCGGLILSRGKDKMAFDPFFSNPSFGKIAKNGKLQSDTNVINQVFKTLNYQGISTCLISHAHYDHLMDVPYIAKKYFQNQLTIYGSNTTVNILKSKGLDSSRLHQVNANAAVGDSPGKWYYTSKDSTCRFMPVIYEHAPHFKRGFITMKFFNGDYDEVPRKVKKATDWKEGQTLAYLVDFMEGKMISKRIYVLSGGASEGPIGFINNIETLKGKKVDLMVMCAASHENVNNYPQRILSLHQPTYVMAVHWEDFFENYFSVAHNKPVRMNNIPSFFDKMNHLNYQNNWLITRPLKTFKFVYRP